MGAEMAGPLLRRVGDWLPSKWKNHEKVQEITCPILFLSGRSDTIVPPEMMDLLKCAATSSKEAKLVEFAAQDHNDTMEGGAITKRSKNLLVHCNYAILSPGTHCLDRNESSTC